MLSAEEPDLMITPPLWDVHVFPERSDPSFIHLSMAHSPIMLTERAAPASVQFHTVDKRKIDAGSSGEQRTC